MAEPNETTNDGFVFSDAPSEPSSDLACEVCGTPLVYGGRGPKPKRCGDHKKGRTPVSGGQGGTKVVTLVQGIETQLVGIGTVVSVFEPFDGRCIIAGSPRLADALGNVAANDPRVRKALERMLRTTAWGQVAGATAMIAVPILVHHGVIRRPVVMPTTENHATDQQPTG